MSTQKQYSGDFAAMEKKLARVMERLGVEADQFQSGWTQGKGGSRCFVEMRYGGSIYRFENSTEKSAACGRKLTFASDLFAAVVYSLEGLARAIEQNIFTLDMLLAGVPALPAAPLLEACFQALGFSTKPLDAGEVKAQYRRMARVMHPDNGGTQEAFSALSENYNACLRALGI
ncbi:MAG: J domain-containing protein [Oscillospiraceae bacterium]|nr:J domain-containing protein [Oscillospiraceae bacterium]